MSSLGAVQADGYYYPPEYDGRKHGGLNSFRKSHALGKRAKKLKSEGVLVVRFEMPFNVTCSGCSNTIGKGVRFNAEKRQEGSYYTTKIWKFRMRSPCCKDNFIEVKTDPKNTDYIVTLGATRKRDSLVEAGRPGEGNLVIDLADEDQRNSVGNAFEKLEKSREQMSAASRANKEIEELKRHSRATTQRDYAMNRQLRRSNRSKRNREKALVSEGKALGLSSSIKLLPKLKDEPGATSFAVLKSRSLSAAASSRAKRRKIRKQSIFG